MITLTDMFCGAGGSSTGAIQVPGVSVRLAMNHWDLAIETHNSNHPDADHALADISAADPRFYPTSDILWASPECTNHSQASGRRRNIDSTPDLFDEVLPDAAADRSRATMWDVPRFAEHHRYKAIITENVVDAAKWILFPSWLDAMDRLGYDRKIVYLNSMHAQAAGMPAPQSRDRMYVVFWRKGNRAPDLNRWTRPKAYCPTCDETVDAMQVFKKPQEWGRYRAQFVYRCPRVKCRNSIVEPGWLPASSAIDWTIKGQRIGDRARPLAPKTLIRIQAGLDKFCSDPFVTVMYGKSKNHATDQPLSTLATNVHHGMLVPAGGTWNDSATSTLDVMRTRTTRDTEALLVPVEGRDGKTASQASDVMRTMTTRNETAFVVPMRNNNTPKGVTEPFDTFAANGLHHAMITRHNGSHGGDGAEMSTGINDTLRTLTAVPTSSLTEWSEPKIDDCLFRMLEPHEIAAGMAFTPGYIIRGNKREQVRQAGNAVTPPAARDLISAVTESLVS